MKMKVLCVIVCLVVYCVGILGLEKLPDDYKKCKFGPDYNVCMKDAINDALPKILTGYKELGLPSLEPFYIKSIKIHGDDTRSVNLKQELINLVMPDFISDTVIIDFQIDLDKHEILFAYKKPKLHMDGDYTMDGRVLILPIQGRGKCSIVFTGLEVHQKLKFEDVVKNGELYWHFKSVHTKMTLEKMETYFENMFNGDKTLGDSTNKFINENWQDIFTELEPQYSQAFSGISLKVLNKFFSQIPVKRLLAE